MAPGNWNPADVRKRDQRPGFYSRFVAEADLAISGGQTGVVACAARVNWGPLGEDAAEANRVNSLESIADYEQLYGSDGDAYLAIREMFIGGAARVIFYRVDGTGDAAAVCQLQDDGKINNLITLTAKYRGTRFNRFEVDVDIAGMANDGIVTIRLKDGPTVVTSWISVLTNGDVGLVTQLVNMIQNDENNIWIEASTTVGAAAAPTLVDNLANNTLDEVTGSKFVGGIDPSVASINYQRACEALETEAFNVLYFDLDPNTDATIWGTIRTLLTGSRTNGRKVVWVTGSGDPTSLSDPHATAISQSQTLTHEGIVYVHPGSKIRDVNSDVKTRYGFEFAARAAGVMSGIGLSESVTFRPISGIEDVEVRYGVLKVRELLAAGVLVPIYDGRQFKFERGVNTLGDLREGQKASFRKIKIIRILDSIENALNASISDRVIGKILNDTSGRLRILNAIRAFLRIFSEQGLIDSIFIVEEDPNYASEDDRFFVRYGVTPIDSIEFVYNTVQVF